MASILSCLYELGVCATASLHFFIRASPNFFSIKETKIFLFCLPADAGIAETLFHPIVRLRRKAGGQKFLPPDPLPFCPPAGNPQRFFRTAAGPKEEKKEKSPLPQPSRARATTRNSLELVYSNLAYYTMEYII